MNELFVNVKVDREERPDVDSLYMDAVVTLTGHGGWPMTVFLTSDGEPFYGGTYYPPEPRHGMPAFSEVLTAVAEAYRERRGAVTRSAQQLVEAVRRSSELSASSDPLTEDVLRAATGGLRSTFDSRWGGFGGAPKFPPASALEFLLRAHRRYGDDEPLAMVRATLDGMAAGGMYDLVGGGFHRYSVDAQWLVPHFEKMLYDNALLASTYLHAWAATGEERYRRVAEETLEYMLRELSLPEGGLASAQDADTDGVEGLTFTWTPEELAGVLGDSRAAAELLQPFEHGRFVLRAELSVDERARLFEARERRPKPARDDKAIASWNGLALAALAEAGFRLGRDDLLERARGVAEFLLGALSGADGRLLRSYRAGQAKHTGFLGDYADVANGLLELHAADGDLRWLEEARRLALLAIELFADEERGGFYLSPSHGERLVARKKEFDDHPTPSGNSMLAYVLLRLARIHGDAELERRAAGVLRLVRNGLVRAPGAFGHALCALDLYLSPPREVAIVGPREDSATRELAQAALREWQPNTVVAWSPGADDSQAQRVPLLAAKDVVDGRPAVYVCESFACRAPITEAAALAGT
ncbi:MAG: thioredoxin domain-containing protein, partial [Actinomycetota bacterium]|nr:thioredoxin domain-containing protein [Actinomycetota bacterium]